ncbi:methylenetetrahydrofolate reductase [NAD(P)H] [Ponticaulis sp.]|uniref:methylenetetrahydrofolate reductase [NAD(P)H] n=1 Tax=Ponticaulis sp. TaxID=2020902 RepID=UPI000B6AEE79|nr:methylenetetrahydrofolate reductase [NAD(P)H] [Ponticaulis sp.]MAI89180.1 methylenetetrahydrofolate reductase [NAD(P)H] [Ponticaulis sp.]OUY01174.1 MAG: methylenetetrahydrofolate reductase [NAD(P)H] [Hyphomonadaceae bacterium TMED5]|tara:strand:+ start:87317 stop:88213 length:897 start_codon:yes stop_codon:yes gene_type:complete
MSLQHAPKNIHVSFEFFPPKTEKAEDKLWESVRRLEPVHPEFVSVTYGAGGSTRDRTHRTVKRMVEETNLVPAAHLTCVSASKAEVMGVVDDYLDAGVQHIVALRGDPPEGMGAKFEAHPEGFSGSIELIEAIRNYKPALGKRFEISVAAYPEAHPDSHGLKRDLEILKAKQDAGADRAITQFFFEPDHYLSFLDAARDAGIHIPIVPGIMLQPNFNGLKRISALCGATLPNWLHELYEGLDDDAEQRELITANVAADLTMKLADKGVKDFHFYTLNKAGLSLSTCRLLGIKPTAKAA